MNQISAIKNPHELSKHYAGNVFRAYFFPNAFTCWLKSIRFYQRTFSLLYTQPELCVPLTPFHSVQTLWLRFTNLFAIAHEVLRPLRLPDLRSFSGVGCGEKINPNCRF